MRGYQLRSMLHESNVTRVYISVRVIHGTSTISNLSFITRFVEKQNFRKKNHPDAFALHNSVGNDPNGYTNKRTLHHLQLWIIFISTMVTFQRTLLKMSHSTFTLLTVRICWSKIRTISSPTTTAEINNSRNCRKNCQKALKIVRILEHFFWT